MPLPLGFVLLLAGTSDSSNRILENIRQKALAQISRSSNYACVETIERTYQRSTIPHSASCRTMDLPLERKEIMRDRLRLDLAVSDNAEIYSWHGENKFSSNAVSDIVQGGPISSGSFVGYLRNVFLKKNVQFTFAGTEIRNGVEMNRFHYVVPKGATDYAVKGSRGIVLVAFHGDFWAEAASSELKELTVTADDIPSGYDICTADSEIRYQLTTISGVPTLIPAAFQLRLVDDVHMFTVSQAQFAQCHEFRAESTLSFDVSEASAAAAAIRDNAEKTLPAGLKLKLALQTPIDDQSAYTGDSVQAVLRSRVKLSDGTLLVAGSAAHGIITELEAITLNPPFYFLRINFDRLTSNGKTYLMKTTRNAPEGEASSLARSYRGTPPQIITNEITQGSWLIPGKHFHLRSGHMRGEWETRPIGPQRSYEAPVS